MKILIVALILLGNLNMGFTQNIGKELFKAVSDNNLKQVKVLVNKKGADVNYARKISDSFEIPVIIQAIMKDRNAISEYLIEKGADVNAKDGFQMTCLIWAASNGNIEMVKLLLKKGADKNAKTPEGMTALISAKQEGHTQVMRLLKNTVLH